MIGKGRLHKASSAPDLVFPRRLDAIFLRASPDGAAAASHGKGDGCTQCCSKKYKQVFGSIALALGVYLWAGGQEVTLSPSHIIALTVIFL